MKQDGSTALFRYWNDLRDGRPAPRHSAIEPADIRSLLSDTFILERDGRGEAVFRLAGTRLCATHGRELKGFSFPSLWRARDQNLASQLVASTFDHQSVSVIDYRGFTEKGRAARFELLLLPLEGPSEAERCLGIAVAVDNPFWLGAEALVSCEIESVRSLDVDAEAAGIERRMVLPVPPLAPDAILVAPNSGGARRVRHLLVLDGGREDLH